MPTQKTQKHFVYAIRSTDPSPTGRGTPRGWLEYYKLDHTSHDLFVRWPASAKAEPVEGDVLWFQVDDEVIARVNIFGAYADPMSGETELHYAGIHIQRFNILADPKSCRQVRTSEARKWQELLSKTSPSGTPKTKSTGSRSIAARREKRR